MAEARKPIYIGRVIADSAAMQRVLATVERIAAARTPVVIHGETGVGKGLMAKIIHRQSTRARQLFMPLNCSALTEQLLESELFGHERGAFTGAASAKQGLFEVADGGTLFLDEFTEMSHGMQTKLLQVLDSGTMRRVGGTGLRSVDVRILAASNKDLKGEVDAGRFRSDLFFRLNVVTLRIPPLRERREDIPDLVALYLDRFQEGVPDGQRKQVSAAALELLCAHPWPGNVRQLANTIERSVLLAEGRRIGREDLFPTPPPETEPIASSEAEPPTLAEVERRHILRVLESSGGVKAQAARRLGINVKTLGRKLKVYGIQ
jgi:two-component system NtrC family response regulator